ncbi:MAG: hypothetical protein M3Y58_15080 [Chloroflexota bacterium]|nr:hypothetical protein [Chloroflexota bacterium]
MLAVDRLLTQRTMAVQQIDWRIVGVTFAVAGFISDPIFSFFQVDVFGAARQHHYIWLYNIVGAILFSPLIYFIGFRVLIDYSRHCVIDLSQRRQSRVAGFIAKNGASIALAGISALAGAAFSFIFSHFK